jgi:hypothetical protein
VPLIIYYWPIADLRAQFLSILFRDIHALIKDFSGDFTDYHSLPTTLRDALEDQLEEHAPRPADMKAWRVEAEQFQECWLQFKVSVWLLCFLDLAH